MHSAKDVIIKPISASDANRLCKMWHYSGKVVPNSQLHFGAFLNDTCHGVMQFGPSINKKGTINLVRDTPWNGFIELNRLAFNEALPKNSESRCLGITHRLIKKHYPHIKWIISFADATQCGDGAIYRAANYVLTAIRKNEAIRVNPATGQPMHVIQAHHLKISSQFRTWAPVSGYQLRYLFFLDKTYKDKLTVPVIPFSKIKELGISMYKGVRIEHESNAAIDQMAEDGAVPTDALQLLDHD